MATSDTVSTLDELVDYLEQTGYEMSDGSMYPNRLTRERLKFVIGPLVVPYEDSFIDNKFPGDEEQDYKTLMRTLEEVSDDLERQYGSTHSRKFVAETKRRHLSFE